MKLEVGKTYKNLAGQLVTIVRCSEDGYLFYDYKEDEQNKRVLHILPTENTLIVIELVGIY